MNQWLKLFQGSFIPKQGMWGEHAFACSFILYLLSAKAAGGEQGAGGEIAVLCWSVSASHTLTYREKKKSSAGG